MSIPDLMHATQVARPFHTKGWVYEEKYDGTLVVPYGALNG